LDKLSMTGLGLWSTLGLLWLSWVVYKFVKAYQRAVVSHNHWITPCLQYRLNDDQCAPL
jgi:hypothetical protein